MASHEHGHNHGHGHGHDLTHQNRAFFDDLAAKYDIKPWQQKASQQATDYIHQNLTFIAIPRHHPTKLLDYACGTGMISRALGPSVDSIYALDLSPNMIERYNDLAKESDIPSVRAAHALEANLLADGESSEVISGPDWHEFDIASVGLALHHFPDPKEAIERLVQRLKVGGVLLIVDFLDEGDANWVSSDADRTIHKHGFSEEEMKVLMEGQGLGGFGWTLMPEAVVIKMDEARPLDRKLFLARGEKLAAK